MSERNAGELAEFRVTLGRLPQHNPRNGLKIAIENLDFWYGEKHALKGVTLDLFDREVTALIGPSGCGKTTLLRCLNRTHEIVAGTRLTGRITLDGRDIFAPELDPPLLRRRFGWVAQKPNPFPSSVRANILYGARLHGLVSSRAEEEALVERCLRRVAMWDEVKDRLNDAGTDLSGGQQQRLCIARAIALNAEVILMDEPASALDPVATAVLENLIDELRDEHCIVIITHNMQQAARVAQRVAMFHLGKMVEVGDANHIFVRPQHFVTEDYLTGRYG